MVAQRASMIRFSIPMTLARLVRPTKSISNGRTPLSGALDLCLPLRRKPKIPAPTQMPGWLPRVDSNHQPAD